MAARLARMAELRCAVVMLPAQNGDPDRLAASLDNAACRSRGSFTEIETLQSNLGDGALPALQDGAAQAFETRFDWLLAVSTEETMVSDVFQKIAPALRICDAVWGGAGSEEDGSVVPLERLTRLAAQDYAAFFHLALQWWIGPTHFVRPGVAAQALATARGSLTEYRLALWKEHRSLKAAHALTLFHGPLPSLPDIERQVLLSSLDREPVFSAVYGGGRTFRLPYTGRNPVVERDHTRGQFFEHGELEYLAGVLPRGLRIVDIGANTGNHTVFFSGVMEAQSVVPLEPDPRACAAIRTAVQSNGLENVRLDLLGFGVGAEPGRMHPVFSAGGGLGATRLVAAEDGEVEVRRLDDLPVGRVDFLKVDVEGMEMAVLAGARGIIERDRPKLFVEVLDETIPDFLGWLDARGYRMERLFPDKTHSNYLVSPAGSRR